MNHHRVFTVLLGLLVYTSPSLANRGWQFRLSPYIWFAGLKGDVATIPDSPSVPIDISPSDAFEDTEVGVMLMLDAKSGRHGVFADFIYTDVCSDAELIPPPISLTLQSKTKTNLFAFCLSVRDLQSGSDHR